MITRIDYTFSTNDGLGDWTDPETGIDHTEAFIDHYEETARAALQKRFPEAEVNVSKGYPGDLVTTLSLTSDMADETEGIGEEEQEKVYVEHLLNDAFSLASESFVIPETA